MTRKTKDRIMAGTAIVLSLALAVFVLGFINKNNDLKKANEEIKHKQTTIEQQTEEKSQLEARLKETQSQLENEKQAKFQLESEKSKLENENSKLKKEITELKAKKEAGSKSAVSNLTAVTQNPQPTGKICYLTFDDGPTDNTLKILKILKANNVLATFFVVDTPQTKINYISQAYADGHTIGFHTASHNYSHIYSSVNAYYKDFNAIVNKVKSIIGVNSFVMRFPGGSSNQISSHYSKGIMSYLTSTQGVAKYGYTYFDWNVDSGDASGKLSASKIVNNVLQGAKGKNSICVLMHDAAAKTTTVDALPGIIKGLKEQGFTFKPLTKESYGYHHSVQN